MPNVNTIIVLSANRFGMASLYQLRGRVGRSPRQAYAAFLTNSTSITVEAETRLQYLRVFFIIMAMLFTNYIKHFRPLPHLVRAMIYPVETWRCGVQALYLVIHNMWTTLVL